MQHTPDWRVQMPEPRRRIMRAWLWSIALVTLAVLVVGGVTRLTHSGLSMVEWEPILGVVPPTSDAQWQERFQQYQQFPEYQKLRQGMTLSEFKFIFFWEYLHRVLARSIGVVFLLPFAFFLVRRWFNRPLALRALALFALGAAQGVMGWLMVASGLVDRPSVSHYRLAAHLSLAFLIFGYAVWLARELKCDAMVARADPRDTRALRRALAVAGTLLSMQIIWGAFVAGLKAGFFANTFPLMAGRLIPPGWLDLKPVLRNFFENGMTVQWLHRVIGTVLLLAFLALFVRAHRAGLDRASARFAAALLGLVLLQYLLGVLTLLHAVPLLLAVLHQALALLIWGVWVAFLHHARRLQPAAQE